MILLLKIQMSFKGAEPDMDLSDSAPFKDIYIFNNKMYNTKKVRHAFKNKFSPIQFIQTLQANNFNLPQECKIV